MDAPAIEIYRPETKENYYASFDQYTIPPSTLSQTHSWYQEAYRDLDQQIQTGSKIQGTISSARFESVESGTWIRPENHPYRLSDNRAIEMSIHTRQNVRVIGILNKEPIQTSIVHTWRVGHGIQWIRTKNSIYRIET